MPDQPGKGPPSSAPLSVEDADRIADSFTPFWEDERDPSPSALPATELAPAAVPSAVPAARKPVGKQTLVGMAPPIISRAPSSVDLGVHAHAPSVDEGVATDSGTSGFTQPLPKVAPLQASPRAPLPHNKTLIGFSGFTEAAPNDATQDKPAPGVTGYAIAYTPKDGPSTPAVVIAPEAQSEPDHDRPELERTRPMQLTMPSRARAAAVEAPRHVPSNLALDDDFNPYAKSSKGKLIGALVVGAAAIAIGVFALRGSSGDATTPSIGGAIDVPTAAPAKVQATPPPTTAAADLPLAAAIPTASAVASAPPRAEPPKAEPTPTAMLAKPLPTPAAVREPTPVAVKSAAAAATRPKAEPVAPARPATRSPSTTTVPSESNSVPSKPASKGVIVRDAPF